MSGSELEAIRALERLFLQSGAQGGWSVIFNIIFSLTYPPLVQNVLDQFESHMKSRFPGQEISLKR
jgi:pSer/pThr/pTyr-binding forkhead associated (FHA) protein